jgi:hypothetical protein
VLRKVCRSLCFIPLKSHGLYLSTVLGVVGYQLKSSIPLTKTSPAPAATVRLK